MMRIGQSLLRILCAVALILLLGQAREMRADGTPDARGVTQSVAGARPPVAPSAPRRGEVANLIPVPLCRQAADYTCGVSVLQAILAHYGIDYREETLTWLLAADPKEGTRYAAIERIARQRGLDVKIHRRMTLEALKSLIDQKIPVIVLLQAWSDHPTRYATDWEDGHYAIVVGYDARNLYFMDPSTLGHYTFISQKAFEERWHDRDGQERLEHFGMIIIRKAPPVDPDTILPME